MTHNTRVTSSNMAELHVVSQRGLLSTAMSRGRTWLLPGRMPVTVVFGAPMKRLHGESADHFAKRLHDAVRDLHLTVAPLPVGSGIKKGTR